MKKFLLALLTAATLGSLAAAADAPKTMEATFAGGCFWCMEPPFKNLDGVLSVKAGYTGGATKNPSYEEVSSGATGHLESINIVYDPSKISYEEILDVFWRNIDPTQADGQFVDVGTQYKTAVFYHSPEQKKIAEASKQQLAKSGRFQQPIVTEIRPASTFYPAEDYHQDFYKKSPAHYHQYRAGSGRDQFIEKTWGTKPAPHDEH